MIEEVRLYRSVLGEKVEELDVHEDNEERREECDVGNFPTFFVFLILTSFVVFSGNEKKSIGLDSKEKR
jgi:hypothetical protein